MEAAIDTALGKLSSADFQRLAEAYAEIRWPERYRHLIPEGRNAFNATTKGWPDAWTEDSSGDLHVVEATLQTDWTTHLDSDIANAEGWSSLASFAFICRANQPRPETLKPRKDALAKLGLAPGDIALVFRQQLRRDLSAPRFDRVRADLLRLPSSASPFVALEAARGLYSDGSSGAIAPTRNEYASPNCVWRNEARPKVVAQLESSGWAFVQGHGAAGKTVLCVQLGLEHLQRLTPAFYLDVASAARLDARAAIDAMSVYGGEGVLFIIDNVHLAEAFTGEIFDMWDTRRDDSQLLMSSRYVSREPWERTGDLLSDLRRHAVAVTATPEDVFGTYRRLAGRIDSHAPDPTRYLTRRWSRLFKGDLVAFGAALTRLQALGRLFADLSPEHAKDYVKDTYLAPYVHRATAREALLTVAALGVLEIPAPVTVADPLLLGPSLEAGMILRTGETLTMAHAGLARLILAAAARPEIDVECLVRVARADNQLGAVVARRVAERGERRASEAFWEPLVADGTWSSLLPSSVENLPEMLAAVQRAGGPSLDEVDETVADALAWEDAAKATTVRGLVLTMASCAERMPRCSARIAAAMFPDGLPAGWLLERLGEADAQAVVNFRRVTKRFNPDVALEGVADMAAIAQSIASEVVERGVRRRTVDLVAQCLRQSLGGADVLDARLEALGNDVWFQVAASSNPKRLAAMRGMGDLPATAARIDAALADARLPRLLTARALKSGTGGLTNVLMQLRDSLPGLHRRASEYLAEHVDVEAWADRALTRGGASRGEVGRAFGRTITLSRAIHCDSWSIIEMADAALASPGRREQLRQAVRVQTADALGRVLRDAPRHWPGVDGRLREFTTDEVLVAELARELSNASVSELRMVLVDHPLARAVLAAISAKAWSGGRPVIEASLTYQHFPAVAAGLTRFDRSDLARPVAAGLAEALIAGDVPVEQMGLAHVSHLFRLLPSEQRVLRQALAQALDLAASLERTATMSTAAVAQAVYSIACHGPEAAAGLPPEPLQARIDEALNRKDHHVVRLIGALSLVREVALTVPSWLDATKLRALVTNPRWDVPHLPPGLVQTLLGLRALEANGADVQLDYENAVALAERCDQTQTQGPRHVEVIALVRGWLLDRRG